MISTIISGRLCNYLFQTAMVYCYAKKHGFDWVIPTDKYDALFPSIPHTQTPIKGHIYKDPRPHKFREWPRRDNVVFEGWFQSFKYFVGYESDLRKLFGLNSPQQKGVVSIHVRRGDYVEYQASFPVLPLSYYEKAIKSFMDNGFTNFKVFSDDIEWCKDHLPVIFRRCSFEFPNGTPLADLIEMTNCEHSIIANSSFSHLAALLNPNQNKIVIAPNVNQWYGPVNHTYTLDMIPDSFIQISY